MRAYAVVPSLLSLIMLINCSRQVDESTQADGTSQGGSAMAGSASSKGGVSSQGGRGGVSAVSSSSPIDPNYVEPADSINANSQPTAITKVELDVASSAIVTLDADPFDSPDVVGAFIDEAGTHYDSIGVNYRGAYALQSLIQNGATQRNWKLKFAKDKPYYNRREWNLTYQPHIRERLAYWLMHLAGVKLPVAEHVVLNVSGSVQGLYLKYEDPDNKPWLKDAFGDDSGDLYKAAYDIPNQTPYFATLEVLGSTDADYVNHYRKMTNNDDPAKATDYSSLRQFIADLNQTPDAEFEAFLRKAFDVDKFLGYLVVANFISNWDGLPERPKNYWLYQVPAAGRWVYIPWDMDATFQSNPGFLNPMGTTASVFYQFDGFVDYEGRVNGEGTKRPLITRMMKVPAFRSAYVARYRQTLSSYLAKSSLLDLVSKLSKMASDVAQSSEQEELNDTRADIENFIEKKTASVTAELAKVQ